MVSVRPEDEGFCEWVCGFVELEGGTWRLLEMYIPPFPPHQRSWRGPRFAKGAKDGATGVFLELILC